MRYLFLIVLWLCVPGIGCWKNTPPTHQDAGFPLVLEKKQLDIGDINEGESKSEVLSFTNVGKSPITIEEVTASCGCTSAKAEPDLIPPGGRGKLSVQLSAQGRRGKFGSQVNLRWAEKTGSRTGKCTAVVTGNALYSASLSPTYLDFAIFKKSDSLEPKTLELTRGTQPLPFTDITVESTSDSVSAEIQKISDQKWSIAAHVLPGKLPIGPLLASITLIFRDIQGNELIQREVRVRGEIKGLVTVKPKSLYLGVLAKNESKRGTICFEVPHGKSATIKTIRIEPDNNCMRFENVKPIERTEVASVGYIANHPGKPGNLSGRVIIEFADKELGEVAVPLILYAKDE